MLSRSLARGEPLLGDPLLGDRDRISQADGGGRDPMSRDDVGVFAKFAEQPHPAISHAMRIPTAGFTQLSSFPIGSMPVGSMPIGSSVGSMPFGMSPEVCVLPTIMHVTGRQAQSLDASLSA